ncbi:MAG: hypothetical protein HXX15_06220 [Rhodopseudomonas sp.]|uniref:hypothetical protein n=1 Tax=Rhodopseudomonas sp. TaxID=1078 RepID=UPI0017DC9677|nr:hypothetical protein [Rhodopseudomonas sp.]NVN85669.1 hypothetical protein [Rhodopseudomonas sp.]
MSHAFIIEVKSQAAGIVVRDGRFFRFHAATHDFNGLDGRGFSSPGEAQKAAIRHAAELATTRVGERSSRLQTA